MLFRSKSLAKAKLQDGTITTLFERKGKESVTFSMKQHTYTETRSVNILYTSITSPKNLLTVTFFFKSRVCPLGRGEHEEYEDD